MGYVSIYAATKVAETARQCLKSDGMTEEEIDERTLKLTARLVLITFGILVFIIVTYVVFDEQQFCFMHDIREFFTDPSGYLRHNFGWICK
jgi:hypothetical protein